LLAKDPKYHDQRQTQRTPSVIALGLCTKLHYHQGANLGAAKATLNDYLT
jgi:hypothetical protein